MAFDEHYYSDEEIGFLLLKAETLGFSLEAGSDIEKLTIAELDKLVNTKQ